MTGAGSMFTVNINMIQSVAIAIVTYYFGVYLNKHISFFQRYSFSAPVVGGMTVATVLSCLEGFGLMRVVFDTTLQSQLMLAFFTTIGLMASLKVLKVGGKLLVIFLIGVSVLAVLQNILGMSVASIMGIDPHYGILAGSVSMMGGLGTSAAFGPYFEQTYGITGGTVVAITAATFGMAASLMLGGPIGEHLIRRYKIKTPKDPKNSEPDIVIPDDLHTDVVHDYNLSLPAGTPQLMRATAVILFCMATGSVVSSLLGHFITLPGYIGSMIVAAIVRNICDYTKIMRIEGQGLNAIADISLVLFVTMAINALKLHELANLALPLMVILAAQTVLMIIFARFILFYLAGRDFDAVMLTVGGVGFAMGATANGLANMQGVGAKYGESPKAWLIVSLVGAFLIDFVNAILITTMAGM